MLPHHIYKLYEQSRRQRIADGTHCSMMGRRTDIMSSRSLCVCVSYTELQTLEQSAKIA